jgi:hypothetical protein
MTGERKTFVVDVGDMPTVLVKEFVHRTMKRIRNE